MNDTPTPRTDKIHEKRLGEFRDNLSQYYEMTDHAKTLERRLTSAREELKDIREMYYGLLIDHEELVKQRGEARREAERWRDCFKSGMSMQPKAPSQVFPWENAERKRGANHEQP